MKPIKILVIILVSFVFFASEASAVSFSASITNAELMPGDTSNIIATISTEDKKISGVTIGAEITPFTNYINSSTSFIQEIAGGNKSIQVNLPLTVTGKAEWGSYAVHVYARYTTEDLDKKTEDAYVKINVTRPSLLDITEVNTTKQQVKPGEYFTAYVKVKNEGVGALKNIRILISYEVSEQQQIQPGTAFSPSVLTQSNLQYVEIPFTPIGDFVGYIDRLEPGEEGTAEFPLISSKSADSGPYSIPVVVFYQDERGSEQTEIKNVIGVILGGSPKLGIAGVRLDPTRVHKGNDFTLSVQLENLGTGDAKSVKAKLGSRSDFLGTISASDIGSAIFDLHADSDGTYKMPIEVNYTDESGTAFTFNDEVTIFVHPESDMTALYVAPAVILAVLALYIWRKKRRALKND